MTGYHHPTEAETLIGNVIGTEPLGDLQRASSGTYPESFTDAIERLRETAESDPLLRRKLSELDYSDRDDPRLKELVDMVLRYSTPNKMEGEAALCLTDVTVEDVLTFLQGQSAEQRAEKLVIPEGLEDRVIRPVDPTKIRLSFVDEVEGASVDLLLSSHGSFRDRGRANIVISDGRNWMQSLVTGPKMINALIAWIDRNDPAHLPNVVKSIMLFEEAFEKEPNRGIDSQNFIHVPLHRSGKALPSGIEGFAIA